uniref:Uncharacterized protein n=1 Tax=Prymnesium polylepis TaxID=72548 RepID=A0A6V4KLS6_9EUKA
MAPRTSSEGHGGTTEVVVPGVTYEYMNPNYKESLPREWYNTSFQLLPTDEVLKKIKGNDPAYTVLDASCRQLQGSRIEIISECCKGNSSITEIDLRGNGFDADGLYAMVQALKTMPNVKKLNLRGNTCRNEGVEALADYLKTNKTITTLNLNENNLGSPGAVVIAGALKENTTLTEVDLSLNYIDDAGGKAIADMLASNSTLKVLGMSGNEIEDKELRKKCRSRK